MSLAVIQLQILSSGTCLLNHIVSDSPLHKFYLKICLKAARILSPSVAPLNAAEKDTTGKDFLCHNPTCPTAVGFPAGIYLFILKKTNWRNIIWA